MVDIRASGPDQTQIAVKVVPGASRDQIAGPLGDRLKIRVSAAPEAGKANKAVCRLLAQTLGIAKRNVTVATGKTDPEKIIAIDGLTPETVRLRLGLLDGQAG